MYQAVRDPVTGQVDPSVIVRTADGATIPAHADNMDWVTFQAWRAAGGVPTPPPALTPAQALAAAAQQMMAQGLTIVSAGTPALNGVYPVDPMVTADINAEITSILLSGTFGDGGASILWNDAAGGVHSFTVPQFKAFAVAVGKFVQGAIQAMRGNAASLPASAANIP